MYHRARAAICVFVGCLLLPALATQAEVIDYLGTTGVSPPASSYLCGIDSATNQVADRGLIEVSGLTGLAFMPEGTPYGVAAGDCDLFTPGTLYVMTPGDAFSSVQLEAQTTQPDLGTSVNAMEFDGSPALGGSSPVCNSVPGLYDLAFVNGGLHGYLRDDGEATMATVNLPADGLAEAAPLDMMAPVGYAATMSPSFQAETMTVAMLVCGVVVMFIRQWRAARTADEP